MAAISTDDKVTVVRFDGVGARISGSTESYVYRTPGPALSYTTTAATVSALSEHPTISPARMEVLDPIGTAGGTSLKLTYSNDNALVTALARRTITPLKGTLNENIYTTAFVASGDASMVVSGDVSTSLSVGDLIWFGTCVAYVTSVSTDTIGFTQGHLDSAEEDIPYTGEGVLLFTSWPDLIGRRVEIAESDATVGSRAGETIVYRGVVEAVVPDGPELTIRVKSRMQQMFGDGGRKFFAPQSLNRTGSAFRDGGSVVGGGRWDFPRDTLWGDPTWEYLRILNEDDKWAVIKVVDDGSSLSAVRRYVPDSTAPNIIQMGRAEDVYEPDKWEDIWADGTGWGLVRAEYAWVTEDQKPSDILLDMLQGSSLPWSVAMRLHDDEIDATTIVSRMDVSADMLAQLRSPGIPSEFDFLFVMPYYKPNDIRIAEIMADELLGPLGMALTPDKTGVVTIIDFREVYVIDDTVVGADVKSGPIGATPRSTGTVVRTWSYSTRVAGADRTEVVHSVLATMIHGGGKTKAYDLRMLASELSLRALRQRAQALSSTYERAVPEGGFSVATSIDADAGKVLKVTCSSLPGDDGVRGSGFQRFFVTERGKAPGGAPRLRGLFLGTEVGARWAPAARVQSFSAGVATIYTQVFTDPTESDEDSDKFEVGDYVDLLDQYGSVKVSTREITAVAPGKLTVSGMGSAVDGDYIVLSSYDDTGHDNDWAWLADDSARLGATNDIGPVWT